MEVEGPFYIQDILQMRDVVQKKGIERFETHEFWIYTFEISNLKYDTLFVEIDKETGMILTNSRLYLNENNGYKVYLGFPIIDYAPSIIDTILPMRKKKYYTYLYLPISGTLELWLLINSHKINLMNPDYSSYHDEPFLLINHPFFLFEIEENRKLKQIKVNNFHKRISN